MFWYRLIPLLSVPSDLNSGNRGILNEGRFPVVTPLKLAGRKNQQDWGGVFSSHDTLYVQRHTFHVEHIPQIMFLYNPYHIMNNVKLFKRQSNVRLLFFGEEHNFTLSYFVCRREWLLRFISNDTSKNAHAALTFQWLFYYLNF